MQILEKVGARIKKEMVQEGETKKAFLRKRENWRKIIAKAAGVGFIWLIGGTIAGMTSLGVTGIHVIIEDP